MSASNLWGQSTQFFYSLSPEIIDSAFKTKGIRPIGRVLPLNSLENRVYDVEVEIPESLGLKLTDPFDPNSLVVKFYRPGRWSLLAIQEEHSFLNELQSTAEIPVICPLAINGSTLFTEETTGIFYALFPKVRGRLKDELNTQEKEQIGRLVARIHNLGANATFKHRAHFTPQNYIDANLDYLEQTDLALPSSTLKNYLSLGRDISALVKQFYTELPMQRIHGDLHRGNILWTLNHGPWLVDFDDCLMGPVQQDLWPLFPGGDLQAKEERRIFLEAYSSMSTHKFEELNPILVEMMRTMRMINFNGWIARRWDDPAFKHAFSHFESVNFWESEVLGLREQFALLSIPPDSM